MNEGMNGEREDCFNFTTVCRHNVCDAILLSFPRSYQDASPIYLLRLG